MVRDGGGALQPQGFKHPLACFLVWPDWFGPTAMARLERPEEQGFGGVVSAGKNDNAAGKRRMGKVESVTKSEGWLG